MKLNGSRQSLVESLDRGLLEVSSSSHFFVFVSLFMFSILYQASSALFIHLIIALSHFPRAAWLTWPWINRQRRRQAAIFRFLNVPPRSPLFIQQRNIHHHKLCVCEGQRDKKTERVYVSAVMMIKLKGILGKINDAWWFGGLHTLLSWESCGSEMLTKLTYKLFHQRDNVIWLDLMWGVSPLLGS